MTIHVTTTHDLGQSFPAATGWHVDDDGRLHVTQTGQGNVATFHAAAWVSAERVTETGGAEAESQVKGITFKVRCPVCNESLSYQHEQPEAWGDISLEDLGCSEVTINDMSGDIGKHLNKHRLDGTYIKAIEKRWEYQGERAAQHFGRKAE